MFFNLVMCVGQRRNLEFPNRKVLGKLITITITIGRKSGSIKPTKLRLCCVENLLGDKQLQVKLMEKVQTFFVCLTQHLN